MLTRDEVLRLRGVKTAREISAEYHVDQGWVLNVWWRALRRGEVERLSPYWNRKRREPSKPREDHTERNARLLRHMGGELTYEEIGRLEGVSRNVVSGVFRKERLRRVS